MSKLLKFKKWLTIEEAEKYLSVIFEEEVTRADILRLALDGELTLSVNFVNRAYAIAGEAVDSEGADYYMSDELMLLGKQTHYEVMQELYERGSIPNPPPKEPYRVVTSDWIGEDQYFKSGDFSEVDGIWDMIVIGNNELNLEHEFQLLTGGPEITLQNISGLYFRKPSGEVCSLQVSFDENEYKEGSSAELREIQKLIQVGTLKGEEANLAIERHSEQRKAYIEKRNSTEKSRDYHSAMLIPEDSAMCVRIDALQELVRHIEEKTTPPSNSITDTTQRNYELAIGLLTKALADKAGPNCGTKEKPNISGLSELLQIYLPADSVGSLSNKALSISTLRKRLKAGYDSLENI